MDISCGKENPPSENLQKFTKIRFIQYVGSGKSAETLLKVCGTSAELVRQISATNPSRPEQPHK